MKDTDNKESILQRIDILFNILCKGDPKTCAVNSCRFHQVCYKEGEPTLNGGKLKPIKRLKAILKYLQKKHSRSRERGNPYDLGKGIIEIASNLLGVSVFEHELVRDCEATKLRIKQCTKLSQITTILEQRKILLGGELNGKKIRFNKNKTMR